MKFKDKYPNMKPIEDEEGGVIRGRKLEPCYTCGRLTEYIDICAEGHVCSEECMDIFYDRMMFVCR